MNRIIRALFLITLLGGFVSFIFGVLLVLQKGETEQQLSQKAIDLSSAQTTLEKTTKKLTTAETTLQEKTTALDSAHQKIASLQSNLDSSQNKISELQSSLASAESAKAQALAEIEKFQSNPLTSLTAGEANQADVTSSPEWKTMEIKQKALEDQLKQAENEIQRVNQLLRQQETEKLPGVSGKIASINLDWNFVVLNIGDQDGVARNAELIVYRNKKMIGKIKVTSTEATTAVADILPQWTQEPIQPGDFVFN